VASVIPALPGGEHPRSSGQLRWHIEDLLAVGKKPGGDVTTDPGTALDRPHPGRPPGNVGAHRPVALGGGGEPPTAQDGLVAGHHLDRH
jgi:hypothetical protein